MTRLETAIATRDEIATLIEWAAGEGWNPGLGDIEPFMAADPEGFHVGRLDGEMVSGVSVTRTGAGFAFLGFYLCAPAHRGQGHGMAVWNAGLAHAGGATIGLDGVVAQQENYRRSGFALAHRNVRHGGRVTIDGADAAGIVAIDAGLLAGVIDFDAAHYGVARPAFLRQWLNGGDGRQARALIGADGIRGYGVIRPCRDGHKIGPLFAEDEASAEALFRALARQAGGGMVYLDPPQPNAAATRLAERHGLAPVFETARMYRGPAPDLPLGRIFGITTFELG